MGKLYDAISESIFNYKQSNSVTPERVSAGREAFNIICYENNLLPAVVTNTYVTGVKVVRDPSMKDCEYRVV